MISESYRKQLKELRERFREEPPYQYETIKKFLLADNIKSVIDFGCGTGNLIKMLEHDLPEISFDGYDPGVDQFNILKDQEYDCLISLDTIEHVEPEYLDITLDKIKSLFSKTAFLVIACYPAKKKLSDGRNAHLIIQNSEWWLDIVKTKIGNVEDHDVRVLNPNKDIISKTGEVLISRGAQIELEIFLRKGNK